jgi:hypothetical protein
VVAEPSVWVDVEKTVRTWARTVMPALAGRVFFGVNNKTDPRQTVLRRVAGTDEECLVQFDVWAETKETAAQDTATLCSAVDGLASFTSGGVRLHGGRVDNIVWLPDDVSDRPRYVVDVTFTAKSF